MKRFFLSLVLTIATICGYAQEHLSFKGIPIEGSMKSFCQKLRAKGFNPIGSDNNISIFSGNFTGQKVTIGVTSTSDGQNVVGLAVFLPKSNEWNTLVNTYSHYKELYMKKYGEPALCQEENPAHSDSNTALMAELYQGTVLYRTAWIVPGGGIVLMITKTEGFYEGQVAIAYSDEQNANAKMEDDLDDI